MSSPFPACDGDDRILTTCSYANTKLSEALCRYKSDLSWLASESSAGTEWDPLLALPAFIATFFCVAGTRPLRMFGVVHRVRSSIPSCIIAKVQTLLDDLSLFSFIANAVGITMSHAQRPHQYQRPFTCPYHRCHSRFHPHVLVNIPHLLSQPVHFLRPQRSHASVQIRHDVFHPSN